MNRRIKVRELRQREGLRGEVVELFHSRNTGLIHGDDRYLVTFNQESLVLGLSYRELSLAWNVTYGIFFAIGSKIPTAINCEVRIRRANRTSREGQTRRFGEN